MPAELEFLRSVIILLAKFHESRIQLGRLLPAVHSLRGDRSEENHGENEERGSQADLAQGRKDETPED